MSVEIPTYPVEVLSPATRAVSHAHEWCTDGGDTATCGSCEEQVRVPDGALCYWCLLPVREPATVAHPEVLNPAWRDAFSGTWSEQESDPEGYAAFFHLLCADAEAREPQGTREYQGMDEDHGGDVVATFCIDCEAPAFYIDEAPDHGFWHAVPEGSVEECLSQTLRGFVYDPAHPLADAYLEAHPVSTKPVTSGLAHTCPDGERSRLLRSGPSGTLEGVTFSCPRCGYRQAAASIREDVRQALSEALDALR